MKKVKRVLTSVLIGIIVISSLTSCGKTKFKADSGFFYSSDKGHTYGDGTKEYSVGETVYMKVKYHVTSDSKKEKKVKVVLTIPNVENVDAKYMDGQVITPNYDAANNVTTYEFTANASKESNEQECVIQFIPNAVGSVTMTLVFDDKLDSSYDKQSTLVFVEPTEEDTSEDVEE
ncbi:MAG TPA: hypothetical protein DCW44_02285 [Eubacterium sp.]|nr:hypothetical protein [Eubacterium sp.]